MDERYKIAPQMEEYDRIGVRWQPFLMYFQTPDYRSRVVNTDARGFRLTPLRDGRFASVVEPPADPACLLVGASTVFGVGATSDATALPALLNAECEGPWLNVGGRGFSSTQEVLLFTIGIGVKSVRKVVIFSGANDLYLYFQSRQFDPLLGSFFFGNQFVKSMSEVTSRAPRGVRGALSRWFSPPATTAAPVAVAEDDHAKQTGRDRVFTLLGRNLGLWGEIARSRNIDVTYVLQPMADWITRTRSSDEDALFAHLLARTDNPWGVVAKHMAGLEHHAWYAAGLRQICQREARLRFVDMNEKLAERRLDGRWLFVDHLHLTDEGHREVARVLVDEGVCA